MELGLSLGDSPKLLEIKIQKQQKSGMKNMGPNFCMDLSLNSCAVENQGREKTQKSQENDEDDDDEISEEDNLAEIPLQLNLLPLAPLPHRISNSNRPCFSHNGSRENGWLEVNRRQGAAEEAAASSANSDTSTGKREFGGSDDDENAPHNPKKLRLSKQQSAFLEQSFKEHNTLNPKQKLALANHLNLRPRQVEVWFQNRRARTKLKQTEVDCEYLKRCCDTLSEENRRLHKELQELRALKTWNPLCMQMSATTLTMCPSCAAVLSTDQDSTRQTIPINLHPS